MQHTIISLSEPYREPLRKLLAGYEALQHDRQYRGQMVERAFEIINDPETVSMLMKKAQHNSPAARAKGATEWLQIISPLVPPEGIGARALYALVKLQGEEVTYKAFRDVLSDLKDGESLFITMQDRTGSIRNKLGHVALRS